MRAPSSTSAPPPSSVAIFCGSRPAPRHAEADASRRLGARRPPPGAMSNSPNNWPESVAIWTSNGARQRIASPWVYKDDDGVWKCEACGGKQMCPAHSRSKEHSRRVWYYCFGYGSEYGPGKLMNAVEKSVRYKKDFNYESAASSMLQPQGGDANQTAGAAKAEVPPAAGSRWAVAAQAAQGLGQAEAASTPVQKFKIDDGSGSSSSHGLGTSIDQKLDAVIALTGTMGTIMDKATELIGKIGGTSKNDAATDPLLPKVEFKVDEMKACFEMQAKKINEYKQSIESMVPTLTAQMDEVKTSFGTKVPMLEAKIDDAKKSLENEVKTSFDTKVPLLEAKIDEVKRTFESKVPTLEAKIDEVKQSIESKVPMLEAKIDALTDQVRALGEAVGKPSQGLPQGPAPRGLRGCRSVGSLIRDDNLSCTS